MLHECELCWENGLEQQNFTLMLELLLWSWSSLSPFSGASIISKQLLPRLVPGPNHNRPIAGQLYVWIRAALLNSSVCQYFCPSPCLSLSSCHSLSFHLSLWLIKFFHPVQPTSFNMRPRAVTKYQFKLHQQLSASLEKMSLCPLLFLHTLHHFSVEQTKHFFIWWGELCL